MSDMNEQEALKKLQKEELDILIEFDKFCKKYDLNWFLDSGTALGAMRHNGFIPWDDDIDVGMLRGDYNNFLSLTEKSGILSPGFSVHTFRNTPNYAAMFAKVYKDNTEFSTKETISANCAQGIFIDIFPYDKLPRDKKKAKVTSKRAHLWQMVSYLYHTPTISHPHSGLAGKIECAIAQIAHSILRRIYKRETIAEKYERTISQDNDSDVFIAFAYPVMPGFRKDILLPSRQYPFENKEFPGPNMMDEYLAINYGEWEKLPAPADRKTHLPIRLRFSDGTSYEK